MKAEFGGLKRRLMICVILSAVCSSLGWYSARARMQDVPPKPSVERTKFRLFKYQGAVGEEVAELTRSGDSLSLNSKLKLSYLGSEVALDATVLIAGSRITAVGPRTRIKIPVGAGFVDARGKTILPGLWDMHTHYTQVEMGAAYLAAGITTARDCGNDLDFIFLLPLFRAKNVKPPPGQLPPLDFTTPEAKRALQFFKDRGTVIEPTLARFEFNTHAVDAPYFYLEPGAGKAPRELADIYGQTGAEAERALRAQAVAKQSAAVLMALHRAGGPIVAGIDLAVPGHSLHRELELYVNAGMTPMEAIKSATSVPARAMGLANEAGTIEVGRRADLMIVDGKPQENISDIRRVESVIANGRLYDCVQLWRSVGFRP